MSLDNSTYSRRATHRSLPAGSTQRLMTGVSHVMPIRWWIAEKYGREYKVNNMHQAEPTTGSTAVRVLLVEDHTVVRQAFCMLLADARYGVEIIGEAGDGIEAVALAQTLQPDVIVMDLLMPRMGGLEATQAFLQLNPGARVLVLTSNETKRMR